ncbi:hypothetical protein [Ruegeria sp.]|uniref:hypothetical protein n=1 Tax=Ruegeria sp. TaxID=1879320 RepID=UPI003C7EA14E
MAAVFCLAATVANACTPGDVNENSEIEYLASCGAVFPVEGTVNSTQISEATDIGQSLVRQMVFQGFACAGSRDLLVVDCATSKVLEINGIGYAYGVSKREHRLSESNKFLRLIAKLDRRFASDRPLTFKQVESAANWRNLPTSETNELSPSYEFKGVDFDLTCGCKLYYPDSPGAKL